MAFESLTEKLTNIFKGLRKKGLLTKDDVKVALKEVRMALLEADVNFKVVKDFIKTVEERSVGADVLEGLNPGQTVIKIVNEEMVSLLGGDSPDLTFAPGKGVTVIMLCGLNGAGKTTTAAKLAVKLKKRGKRSLLAALDVYRPAAIEQLKINGKKSGNEVFSLDGCMDPVEIASQAIDYANRKNFNVVILDTAGRQQVDLELMDELKRIKDSIEIHDTLLVADACTGQAAVDVAVGFNDKVGVDGVILSKLDGDARGGAALSIRAVTQIPVVYAGMGEKFEDLADFYPDRMASRILGMGDVLSLIEKAVETADIEAGLKAQESIKKGKFDFNDYLMSIEQMKKMGGVSSILSMLPGLTQGKDVSNIVNDDVFNRNKAIICSMTPEERENPKIINPQRKHRIARGSGVDIMYVNRLIKEFEEMQKMMKKLPGLFKGRKGFGGFNPFGGLGGGLSGLSNLMKGLNL